MSGEAPRGPEHTDRLRATPSHRFNGSWTISQGSSAWAGKATASECFSRCSGGPSGATEQGVQADEAPLEAARGMVVGRERGSVVTVWALRVQAPRSLTPVFDGRKEGRAERWPI